jgi:hypothetical protein
MVVCFHFSDMGVNYLSIVGEGGHGVVYAHHSTDFCTKVSALLNKSGRGLHTMMLREAWFASLRQLSPFADSTRPTALLPTAATLSKRNKLKAVYARAEHGTLASYFIVQSHAFTLDHVVPLLTNICAVLAPIHAQHMLHGDIHRNNIVVIDEGQGFALIDLAVYPPAARYNKFRTSLLKCDLDEEQRLSWQMDMHALGIVVVQLVMSTGYASTDKIVKGVMAHESLFLKVPELRWIPDMVLWTTGTLARCPTAQQILSYYAARANKIVAPSRLQLAPLPDEPLTPDERSALLRDEHHTWVRRVACDSWTCNIAVGPQFLALPLALNMLDRYLLRPLARPMSGREVRLVAEAALQVSARFMAVDLAVEVTEGDHHRPLLSMVRRLLRTLRFDLYRPTIQTAQDCREEQCIEQVEQMLKHPVVMLRCGSVTEQQRALTKLAQSTTYTGMK